MYQKVEKVTGMFHGKEVSFKRTWGKKFAHTFTDEEVKDLLAGKVIQFQASDGEKTKKFKGQLEKQSFFNDDGKEIEFYGFKPDFFPVKFCNHVFSEEEKRSLKNGDTVTLIDVVSSKTGNTFNCELSWLDGDGLDIRFL